MLARHPVWISSRLFAAALVSLASACNTTPVQPERPPEPRGAVERLQELQPVDIAVAKIRDQTDVQDVPRELFRNAFVTALIERRYSPLAPDYVDANMMEAAFKGTPPPDALLVVSVLRWNSKHLYSTGRVHAAADVVLFEGADTTGRVLWQMTLEDEIDMRTNGRLPAPSDDMIPRAVTEFAREAFRSLPMRDPVAARDVSLSAQ
jgi:hypothetical protein